MRKSADQVLVDVIFSAPLSERELAERAAENRRRDVIEAGYLVDRTRADEALLAAVGGGVVRPALYHNNPVAVVIATDGRAFEAEPRFGYLSPIDKMGMKHLQMLDE